MALNKEPHFLSLVMPVYNEGPVIEKVVREFCKDVLRFFPKKEFIVVNDRSTDNTLEVLRNLEQKMDCLKVISLEKNSGHGVALRTAYEASRGDLVFHCDSDDQYVPKDFWLLYNEMRKNNLDVVLGYRKNRHDPPVRLLVTRGLRFAEFLLFGDHVVDGNTSFKLHTRKALNQLLSIVPADFSQISVATSMAAKMLKMRMKEIPIGHRPRIAGTPVLVSWRLAKTCLRGFKELSIINKTIKK